MEATKQERDKDITVKHVATTTRSDMTSMRRSVGPGLKHVDRSYESMLVVVA